MITDRPSKIHRPLVSHSLARERLFEQLQAVPATPASAVLAPPGYGKTTLLSTYIDSLSLQSIWFCVDENDSDLASFFAYFSGAVRNATPRRRKTIPHYQREDAMNIKGFSRRYFSVIYQRFEQPFIVVFDDIHTCNSSQWADAISIAIDELPKHGRIMLVGRKALPQELARLNLNQKIHYIREQALRFNEQELIALASLHNISGLTAKQCQKIQATMLGWAAGLSLLFNRKQEMDADIKLDFSTEQELFDYFMNEVIRCIDNDEKILLFSTCFLPDVSVKHAEKVTHNKEAGKLLQQLHDQNYFVQRIDNSPHVYRYHPLFKAFLIVQSKEKLGVLKLGEIQNLSLQLLEDDGAILAAGSLLLDLGDHPGLTQFTLRYAQKLVTENYTHTLLKWLRQLPEQTVENIAWLSFWRGVCVLPMRPHLARQDFIVAFNKFVEQNDTVGRCLSLSGIIDSCTIERDDFTLLDTWISQVELLPQSLYQQLPPPVQAKLTVSMFSALLDRAPHHPDYNIWLERAKNISRKELPPQLHAINAVSVILHYLWQGDFNSASFYHKSFESQMSKSTEPFSKLLWHVIQSAFSWSTGDAQRGLTVAKAGLSLAEEYGLPLLNIPLLSHAAASALLLHDSKQTGYFLSVIEKLADDSRRWHLCFYHLLSTVHTFRSKDKTSALFYAETASHYAKECGSPFFDAMAHFILAQLHFSNGKIKKAEEHLALYREAGSSMHSYLHQFQSKLLTAVIAWSENQREFALQTIGDSLRLAKGHQLLPGLLLCEEEIIQLLVEAVRNNVEADYALIIMKKRKLIPAEPPYDLNAWPWPIRVQTLGGFDIYIDGKLQIAPSRSRPKLLALLKVLIAFGGKNVAEERIIESIWPDAEGDAAHQLFDTTLSRLRKLLGRSDALVNREGKLSLNKKICCLDIWAITETSKKLSSIVNEKNASSEIVLSYQQQFRYWYGGEFLPTDEHYAIVLNQRDKIRLVWTRSLYALADYWVKQKNSENSIDCWQHILRENSVEEKACQLLMMAYIGKEKYAKAATVYHECKKNVKEILNVNLSKDTELIFDNIRHPISR